MPARDELFDADEGEPSASEHGGPRRSFAQYLRETPPAPLPQAAKLGLWAVGVVTVLLFLGALLKMAS